MKEKRIILFLPLACLLIFVLSAAAEANTGISLNYSSISLFYNVEGREKVTLKPKGELTGKIKYKSSDPSVAKVNSKGKVTGLKKGKAVITVSCGSEKAVCNITVCGASLKVTSPSALTLTEGKRSAITVKTAPKTTTVTYASGNAKIAYVNKTGKITAKRAGSTTIYVRSNGITRKIKLTVKAPVPPVETLSWNPSWQYASNSRIHSGKVKLYHAPKSNGIVVAVNAGHGTYGGWNYKTLCHPDGTPKVTGGSTAAGSIYAIAVSAGTAFLDGTSEAAGTLSLALILKQKLLDEGYDVLMIREEADTQLDNVARALFANHYADCHLSLHYDASATNKGFFYTGVPNIASYRAMQPVAQHYQRSEQLGACILAGVRSKGLRIFGTGNSPLDLTQTSYSVIPTLDLEVGDRASLHNAAAQTPIAEAIVDGLNQFYGR